MADRGESRVMIAGADRVGSATVQWVPGLFGGGDDSDQYQIVILVVQQCECTKS